MHPDGGGTAQPAAEPDHDATGTPSAVRSSGRDAVNVTNNPPQRGAAVAVRDPANPRR